MSATATSARAAAASLPSFLARRRVWQVCYLAALPAAVAAEVWGLIARAAGVPMRAASPGAQHASAIYVGMFAMGTMVVTFWFTFAVIAIARFAKNPRRLYLRTTLPLLALSLLVPFTAADTPLSAKFTLTAAHLMAGAIIIPVVASRLSRVR